MLFSNPVMESSTDILENWLLSPKFWKGRKLSEFWVQAHNFIKEKSNLEDFKVSTDSVENASRWNLWNGKDNWEDTLGKTHFDLVTSYVGMETTSRNKSKKTFNTSSVLELLRVIRNKHQHNNHYKSCNDKIKWFKKSGDELHFDDDLYGNYWNAKFPNLGLYLWTRFWQFRDGVLSQFYAVNAYHNVESLRPENLWKDLQSGFATQNNQGYLIARYELASVNAQVEFRTLPEEVITPILSGSQALWALPLKDHNQLTWYEKSSSILCIKHATYPCVSYQTGVITVSTVKHVTDNMLIDALKLLNQSKNAEKRLVILFNRDNESNADEKQNIDGLVISLSHLLNSTATNTSINWLELTDDIKENILNSIKVKLQDKIVWLSDLFQYRNSEMDDLLSKLSPDSLNYILRGNSITVLEKLTVPKLTDIYMERNVAWTTVKLGDFDIKESYYRFVFCAENVNKAEILELAKCQLEDIRIIQNLDDIRISSEKYILHETEFNQNRSEFVNLLSKKCESETIHCFERVDENKFKRLYSYGTIKWFDNQKYIRFHEEIKILSEREFISSLFAYRSNERLIFIADEPGMGKSLYLRRTAYKLIKEQENIIVILAEFYKFLKIFEVHNLCLSKINMAVCKLVSTNDFDEHFFHALLECKTRRCKIEIMLDALDEVPLDLQWQAITVLKAFEVSPLFSRIWVTMRKHMLNKLLYEFKAYDYYLLPFSRRNQIEFLVSSWMSNSGTQNKLSIECKFKELKNFAKSVIKTKLVSDDDNIAGIPLQCRMLADIYESHVLSGNLEPITRVPFSPIDIYDKLINRKLDVYLKEKNLFNSSPRTSLFRMIRQNFENLLVYYSVKLLLSDDIADQFKSHLLSGFYSPEEADSSALEMGVISNLRPLTFIHRTFAEFVLAQFILKGITNEKSHSAGDEGRLNILVWKHVLATQVNSLAYPLPITQFKHPAICNFLNKLLQKHLESEKSENKLSKKYRLKIYSELEEFQNYFVKACPRFFAAMTLRYHYIFYILLTARFEILCLLMSSLAGCNLKVVKNMTKLIQECSSSNGAFVNAAYNQKCSEMYFALSEVLNTNCKGISNGFEEVEHLLKTFLDNLPSVLEDKNADGETILTYLTKVYSQMPANIGETSFHKSSYKWFLHFLVKDGASTQL